MKETTNDHNKVRFVTQQHNLDLFLVSKKLGANGWSKSDSISVQGASVCMTSSYALKQEHLWLCDWSMTGYVKWKNSTLWRNLGIEFQFFSRKGRNSKWSKSYYDATGLGTCFDFLFLEIEEQQLAKVRFKMKRTKVCSFDFFLENTGTTTGQSPFDNATRTSLVSISSSSKNTTYFLAKYHGNRSKRVN